VKKICVSFLLLAACGGKPTIEPPPGGEHQSVRVARQTLPTALELHATVISRSCSPSGGVCHNGKEYPDLRTVGSMIAALAKPCNRDRFLDEPSMVFDGCEPLADELVVGSGSDEWRSLIAYLGPEEFDEQTFQSFRHVKTEKQAPRYMDRTPARIVRNGEAIVTLPANLSLGSGAKDGRIVDVFNLDYASIRALGYVQGGDPNGNGIFGAGQPWQLIAPGHPDRSYLVGRITGSVPGTRMPLANAALTAAEYVAIICWIETLDEDPDPHDRIAYDDCNFAKDPTAY
jgi:hypothetical protein